MPYCKQILHRIHCFKEKQRLVSLFCIVKLMIHLKMHLSPFLQQKKILLILNLLPDFALSLSGIPAII